MTAVAPYQSDNAPHLALTDSTLTLKQGLAQLVGGSPNGLGLTQNSLCLA
jgi:hypothetical protein